MERVSIIIPVTRQDSADRCIDAIVKNSGVSVCDYEIQSAFDVDGIGCPEMVKILVEQSNYDLIMFLGDDCIPEKDFLKHAIEAMESLPDGWGVVGLNTQDINRPGGNPLAHWMAHKKMLDYIPGGSFFSTDYAHCWGDNELKDIADELGRWVWGEKSCITHNHPINKTAEYDEGYQKAYTQENREYDFKTYCQRKRDRMKAKYGTKLAIAVPLTDDKVYNQFLFSFVKVVTDYTSSLAKKGLVANVDILFPDFPCQIDAARNNLVQQALNIGCTHLIMMDSDQIYVTDNMIEKMLAHNKPVLGARVHRRYFPYDPLMLRGKIGELQQVPDDEIKNKDGSFKTEVPVTHTGTGCILYDMQIFNDMYPEKPFELITGEHGQPIGEDINLCTKLGERGIPIVVDASIDIKHLTLLGADWGTHILAQKMMGIK